MHIFLAGLALASLLSGAGTAQAGAVEQRVVPDSGAVPMPGWSATYVTEGTGRPCIVLSLRNYHPRSFSSRFKSQLRCTFLDVRFTAPEAVVDAKSPYTLDAAVEDLEAARKALGLSRFVLRGALHPGLHRARLRAPIPAAREPPRRHRSRAGVD